MTTATTLPAGRLLDAEVAVKVGGWQRIVTAYPDWRGQSRNEGGKITYIDPEGDAETVAFGHSCPKQQKHHEYWGTAMGSPNPWVPTFTPTTIPPEVYCEGDPFTLPHYSTRTSDANALLDRWHGDVNIRRQNGQWHVELFKPSQQWDARGETLPEAICRAMLKAGG